MIDLPGERAACQCCFIVDVVDLRSALERAYCAGAAMALEAGEVAFERNPYGFES